MPLLCIVLNFSESKLPSLYHCIAHSFVLHACTLHLSIVGGPQEPSGTWSIATIKVALRAGNGTQVNNMTL